MYEILVRNYMQKKDEKLKQCHSEKKILMENVMCKIKVNQFTHVLQVLLVIPKYFFMCK